MSGRPRKRAKAGSGINANGDWKPAFPGQRAPLTRGHTLSLRHGSYAGLHLQPRAEEIAATLREVVVEGEFAIAIDSVAMIGARLECAFRALAEASPGELRRLDQDARRWARLWLSALSALGLTPSAHARILRDTGLAKAAVSQAALRGLHEHIEREYAIEQRETDEVET